MARKKPSGKLPKKQPAQKSSKKVVSKISKTKQTRNTSLKTNRKAQDEQKTNLGRGTGLQRWNYVRTQVKTMLNEKGIYPTKDELLSYSSALYKEVKDDFKNKSHAFDVIMDDFFYGSDKEGVPVSFSWWDLDNQLSNLNATDLIVVDNEKSGLPSFEATVLDFRVRFLSQNTSNINGVYLRKEYLSYLHYKKEINGLEINYFLLLPDEDPLSGMNDQEFNEWLKKEGIDLGNTAGRLAHKRNELHGESEPTQRKSKYVEPMKRVARHVPELKAEPKKSKGKRSINAEIELNKMKKKKLHTVLIRELEKIGLNAKQILATIKKAK